MQSFFNHLFFPIADFRSHFPEPASAGIYLFIFIFWSTLLGALIFKRAATYLWTKIDTRIKAHVRGKSLDEIEKGAKLVLKNRKFFLKFFPFLETVTGFSISFASESDPRKSSTLPNVQRKNKGLVTFYAILALHAIPSIIKTIFIFLASILRTPIWAYCFLGFIWIYGLEPHPTLLQPTFQSLNGYVHGSVHAVSNGVTMAILSLAVAVIAFIFDNFSNPKRLGRKEFKKAKAKQAIQQLSELSLLASELEISLREANMFVDQISKQLVEETIEEISGGDLSIDGYETSMNPHRAIPSGLPIPTNNRFRERAEQRKEKFAQVWCSAFELLHRYPTHQQPVNYPELTKKFSFEDHRVTNWALYTQLFSVCPKHSQKFLLILSRPDHHRLIINKFRSYSAEKLDLANKIMHNFAKGKNLKAPRKGYDSVDEVRIFIQEKIDSNFKSDSKESGLTTLMQACNQSVVRWYDDLGEYYWNSFEIIVETENFRRSFATLTE
ncbi:hypothetical protein ABRP53_09515 [Corynebacterium marquesiae]